MTETQTPKNKPRGRVTLRDVAAAVGVHPSTVSRVLNPDTRTMVSPEVAERIAKTAEKMGYHPNSIAYSLKTRRTLTVGVLLPDITNPAFPPIIQGIETALGEAGYTAILANTGLDEERERLLLEKMLARQVDGLMLATALRQDDIVKKIVPDDIPIVLINRTTDDESVSFVSSRESEGMALAVDHLVSLGHTKIAHVGGPQNLSTGHGRFLGFKDAMSTHGLSVSEDLLEFTSAFTIEEGRRALDAILSRRADFTAVVAGNDMLAMGCYRCLAQRSLTCPRDISITGYNDMPFMDSVEPPLTTVHIPLYDMGVKAAEALLERMRDNSVKPRGDFVEPKLIIRGSTAPPGSSGSQSP